MQESRRPQPQLLLRAPAAAANTQLSPAPAAAGSDAPVSIAFCVPECRLQPGEHLRVVGSSPELGDWHVDAALPLEWQEGDAWTAQLSLPPGRHEFKLVVLRDRDGAVLWEDGPNRELPLQPQPAEAAAAAAETDGQPAVIVSCPWGDPAATTPTLASALPGQVQPLEGVGEAAEAQVAAMRRQLRQLADRAAALEREVQQWCVPAGPPGVALGLPVVVWPGSMACRPACSSPQLCASAFQTGCAAPYLPTLRPLLVAAARPLSPSARASCSSWWRLRGATWSGRRSRRRRRAALPWRPVWAATAPSLPA